MKKLFVLLTAMAFVMAMGLPAMATDGPVVEGTIIKNKTVTENIWIFKDIGIFVQQEIEIENSAQAQAVKKDVNTGNVVTEVTTTEEYDKPGHPATTSTVAIDNKAQIIDGSLDTVTGLLNVNQAPGIANNQGNVTAIGYTEDSGASFLGAHSACKKINTENVINAIGSQRSNEINSAGIGITGIATINQSAGNMNNQDNAVSMSIGLNSVATLAEADLGMLNTGNISVEQAVSKVDLLTTGALSTSSGIIDVNQSSGCMNNQANILAVCVSAASVSGL